MSVLGRTLAAAAALAVALWAAFAVPGRAQPSAPVVWVEYEADGLPHARAIVSGPACPPLTAGATALPMTVRAPAVPGFPDTICDRVLPADAGTFAVAGVTLPAVPHAPKTIALFADTGCRLLNSEVQACNDPRAWPFPTIARDVAAAHPDLVVHVGDYYYRETACPAGVACTNSPYGDNAASWRADYVAPMTPVFSVAPIVNVRGNHERCDRSAVGWTRYLSAQPVVGCVGHERVWSVAFDDLVLAVVDDATETTEFLPVPPVFAADATIVDARAVAAHRETWLLAHRPPIVYEATHQGADRLTQHVAAFVSGHIHTFGAYTLAGEAPQILVGMGGDNLASDTETNELAVLGGLTDRRFGYALFTRSRAGWDVVVHDADTAVHRRCRLEARTVHCGPALT